MVSTFGRKRRDIINLNAHIFDAGPKFGRFVTLQKVRSGESGILNWREVTVNHEAVDTSEDTDTVKIAVDTNI